jgi:phage tail tape-measure protein
MTHIPTEPHVNHADHDSLRKLADGGNEKALDRLADLAHARDDVGELNELLDEGSECAGQHLATRAIAARDLPELQRLADEGIEAAEGALEDLLQ